MLRRIHVLTLFPGLFDGFLRESILGKAISDGLVSVVVRDFREFGLGRHRSVDDVPFGGGSGMVLRPGPAVAALESLPPGTRRILLTPQGARFDQTAARRLASEDGIGFLCGRYEGFDERIRAFVDEELSIGDYVLSGGEVAAMVVVEAVSRLLPGVMGNEASADEESFSTATLEYPHYTRPRSFRGMDVPEVLVSGHHAAIRAWRRDEATRRTADRRPDLIPRCGDDEPGVDAGKGAGPRPGTRGRPRKRNAGE